MAIEQIDLRQFRTEPVLKTEEVLRRRAHFESLGFTSVWIEQVIRTHPTLWTPKVVDDHLNGLLQRGFTNPNKMVESSPAILGYAFENIDAKLQGLRERGFTNPNKMVESLPAILGLAFENIDRRLRLYSRLISLYNLPFSPTELMEKAFALFSSKIDKVMILARVLRDYQVTPPQLNETIISRLLRTNLEDTLVALGDYTPGEDIKTLINRANTVRRAQMPRENKRAIIVSLDAAKIKCRYFRGYPR